VSGDVKKVLEMVPLGHKADHAQLWAHLQILAEEVTTLHKALSVLPGLDTPRSPQDIMDVAASLAQLEAIRQKCSDRIHYGENCDDLAEEILDLIK
jgi:regulator of sirC expression with transglutaminase-like and TPR domain